MSRRKPGRLVGFDDVQSFDMDPDLARLANGIADEAGVLEFTHAEGALGLVARSRALIPLCTCFQGLRRPGDGAYPFLDRVARAFFAIVPDGCVQHGVGAINLLIPYRTPEGLPTQEVISIEMVSLIEPHEALMRWLPHLLFDIAAKGGMPPWRRASVSW